MANEELQLVDINTETLSSTWPLLLRAVDHAHFIALDLELSGLGGKKTRGLDSQEERYKAMSGVADTYSVLAIGVACFRWHNVGTHDVHCHVEVFNIWLLSQKEFVIDPQSAIFLLQHGFDFNKQFGKGIPYMPGAQEVLHPDAPSPHALFARILQSGKPLVLHNGWVDLLFLYHTFYCPLPPSLDSFMADLSEMFQGGVFDTKAIAEYELGESASFLEYIFRKSQRENSRSCTENSPHLSLHFTSYPHHTESVSVTPPASCPGVLQLRVCRTFARYGYCHQFDCPRCHDVMVVIEQDEHVMEARSLMRKRARDEKKERRRKQQLIRREKGSRSAMEGDDSGASTIERDSGSSIMEGCERDIGSSTMEGSERDIGSSTMEGSERDNGSSVVEGSERDNGSSVVEGSEAVHMEDLDPQEAITGHMTGNLDPEQSSTTNILQVFQKDLDIARARLSTSSSHGYTKKPSFGHRAGFDAFMTGYSFSHFAVKVAKSDSGGLSTLFSGLSDMRNCLGNRWKPFPMRIVKSHFAKTSLGHRKTWKKIEATFGSSHASEMSTT